MKNIKPIYIYGFGIILAVVAFFIISSQNSTPTNAPSNDVANKVMPQDSIHQGLMNQGKQPGKDNVMASVMQHLDMLKKAVDENPKDTLKIKEYADFLAAAHQPDEAMKNYDKILKVNPKRLDILFSEAYLKYVGQKFADAEKILNRIISIDRNNVQAYYNLGAIAASKGDKAKAKEIWSKLVKNYPGNKIAELAKKALTTI